MIDNNIIPEWSAMSTAQKANFIRYAVSALRRGEPIDLTNLAEAWKLFYGDYLLACGGKLYSEGGPYSVGKIVDSIYKNNPREVFMGEPSHHYDFTQSEEWADAHGYYPDERGHRDDRVKKPAHPSHPSRGTWSNDGTVFNLTDKGFDNPNYTMFGLVDGGQDPQATLMYKNNIVLPEITVTPEGNYINNPYDNIQLHLKANGGNLFSGTNTNTLNLKDLKIGVRDIISYINKYKAADYWTQDDINYLAGKLHSTGWDPEAILYVIGTESSYNPNAANPVSSARGLALITNGTASDIFGEKNYKSIMDQYNRKKRTTHDSIDDAFRYYSHIDKLITKNRDNMGYGRLKVNMLAPYATLDTAIKNVNGIYDSLTSNQKKYVASLEKKLGRKATFADLMEMYDKEFNNRDRKKELIEYAPPAVDLDTPVNIPSIIMPTDAILLQEVPIMPEATAKISYIPTNPVNNYVEATTEKTSGEELAGLKALNAFREAMSFNHMMLDLNRLLYSELPVWDPLDVVNNPLEFFKLKAGGGNLLDDTTQSFDEAYRQAKQKGNKSFIWNNRTFITQDVSDRTVPISVNGPTDKISPTVTAVRTKLGPEYNNSGYIPLYDFGLYQGNGQPNLIDNNGRPILNNSRVWRKEGTGEYLITDNQGNIVGITQSEERARKLSFDSYNKDSEKLLKRRLASEKHVSNINSNSTNAGEDYEKVKKFNQLSQLVANINNGKEMFIDAALGLMPDAEFNHAITGGLKTAFDPNYTIEDYKKGFMGFRSDLIGGLGDAINEENPYANFALNFVNPTTVLATKLALLPELQIETNKGKVGLYYTAGKPVVNYKTSTVSSAKTVPTRGGQNSGGYRFPTKPTNTFSNVYSQNYEKIPINFDLPYPVITESGPSILDPSLKTSFVKPSILEYKIEATLPSVIYKDIDPWHQYLFNTGDYAPTLYIPLGGDNTDYETVLEDKDKVRVGLRGVDDGTNALGSFWGPSETEPLAYGGNLLALGTDNIEDPEEEIKTVYRSKLGNVFNTRNEAIEDNVTLHYPKESKWMHHSGGDKTPFKVIGNNLIFPDSHYYTGAFRLGEDLLTEKENAVKNRDLIELYLNRNENGFEKILNASPITVYNRETKSNDIWNYPLYVGNILPQDTLYLRPESEKIVQALVENKDLLPIDLALFAHPDYIGRYANISDKRGKVLDDVGLANISFKRGDDGNYYADVFDKWDFDKTVSLGNWLEGRINNKNLRNGPFILRQQIPIVFTRGGESDGMFLSDISSGAWKKYLELYKTTR